MTRIALTIAAALVACTAVAGPVTVEWDAPAQTTDGQAIPAALATDLRYSVWSQAFGGSTNWTQRGSTTNNATRLTIDLPTGAWVLGVTAQFLTQVDTRSGMSSGLAHRVYGRVVEVGGVRVVIMGE